eukprot:m.1582527 g.1582527  ORF g.1582527 m.1582527 type:complete len:777 (+) comp25318_c0_seq14:2335-4665(+)
MSTLDSNEYEWLSPDVHMRVLRSSQLSGLSNEETLAVNIECIHELCSSTLLHVTNGSPYAENLAIQCAALARCVAHFIDHSDPAQRSARADKIYEQTDMIQLLRFQNDIHSRFCQDNWFPAPLWAAFVQLRVTLWFVKSVRYPEIVSMVIQRSFFKTKGFMLQKLLTGPETMTDVLSNDLYPIHIRLGAIWSFNHAIIDYPESMPTIYEHTNIFSRVLKLLEELNSTLFPKAMAEKIPSTAILDFGCTNLDSLGNAVPVFFSASLSTAAVFQQRMEADGATAKAKEYWASWIRLIRASQYIPLAIKYLVAYRELADPRQAHRSGLFTALTVLHHCVRDGDTKDFVKQQAADVHKVNLIDLVTHVVMSGPHPPTFFGGHSCLQASMLLAHLVGDAGDTANPKGIQNVIPPAAIETILDLLRRVVDGDSTANGVQLLETVEVLSRNEESIAHIIQAGILDIVQSIFDQPASLIKEREFLFQYNVRMASELAAAILVNLTLSTDGLTPVRAHTAVLDAAALVLERPDDEISGLTKTYASGVLQRTRVSSHGDDAEGVAHRIQSSTTAAPPERRGEGGGTGDKERFAFDVMISYSWANQREVLRIRKALGDRGYRVWIDVEQMAGSTVDAMAAAVETSRVMLYVVSPEYKESVVCRMEANYALELRRQMIPLKMDAAYSPKGWLGIMLGTQLWFGFVRSVLSSNEAFEKVMDALCARIGPPSADLEPMVDKFGARAKPTPSVSLRATAVEESQGRSMWSIVATAAIVAGFVVTFVRNRSL